jgi:hypothetical protein
VIAAPAIGVVPFACVIVPLSEPGCDRETLTVLVAFGDTTVERTSLENPDASTLTS